MGRCLRPSKSRLVVGVLQPLLSETSSSGTQTTRRPRMPAQLTRPAPPPQAWLVSNPDSPEDDGRVTLGHIPPQSPFLQELQVWGLPLAGGGETPDQMARRYLSSRRGWATASFRQAMLASATRLSAARESLVSARRVMKRWMRPSS